MMQAPLELVGLGSSSSMDSFASWKMNGSGMEKGRHMTSIYSLSVTQNWREIQISLEFEIEFVEPNFGAKISLIMISEF